MNAITPIRVAALFSCGEPSACAVKVRQAELRRAGQPYELAIVRCVVPDEHPDNDRFAAQCQEWFGQEIINLRSDRYDDCFDVWDKRRYLNGHKGAPCTLWMKKVPRQDWEREWLPDQHVFGYTEEEADRAAAFRKGNPEINLDCPLIRAGLSAADCAGMIHAAGIARPLMYLLGFKHNNCRGCIKARSPKYWALVRKHFAERFWRLAALCRDIGWTPCRAGDDTPIWLDELPLDTACEDDSADIECSLFCHVEMQKIREAEIAR